MRQSKITFTITLDEKNFPEQIHWEAEESGMEGKKTAKSFMINVWDGSSEGTLRIDLWTKQMMVEEMRQFAYDALLGLADTYARATNEKEHAEMILGFAAQFGRSLKLIK